MTPPGLFSVCLVLKLFVVGCHSKALKTQAFGTGAGQYVPLTLPTGELRSASPVLLDVLRPSQSHAG